MRRHSIACLCDRLTRRIALVFLLLFLCAGSVARSQDVVRPSLAGEAAAEARRQDIEHIPYNLLIGPIRFRVSATLAVGFNDNINLAEVNTQQDVIIRPQVNVNAIWPVTQLNTLRLDLGLGYAFYVDHSNADTSGVVILPGSQLAFALF